MARLNKADEERREFLFLGYCGLVLRGYDNERSIPDPILRKVWRLGKRLKTVKLGKRTTVGKTGD